MSGGWRGRARGSRELWGELREGVDGESQGGKGPEATIEEVKCVCR